MDRRGECERRAGHGQDGERRDAGEGAERGATVQGRAHCAAPSLLTRRIRSRARLAEATSCSGPNWRRVSLMPSPTKASSGYRLASARVLAMTPSIVAADVVASFPATSSNLS